MVATAFVAFASPGSATSQSSPGLSAGVPDYMRYVQVNNFRFDPLGAMPSIPDSLRFNSVPRDQPFYYLVQFNGPVTPAMKASLAATGAAILYYINYNAFVIRADSLAIYRAQDLPTVRWTGVFEPAYKLSPRLSDSYGEMVQKRLGSTADPASAGFSNRLDPSALLSLASGVTLPASNGGFLPSAQASSEIPVEILPMETSRIPEILGALTYLGGKDIVYTTSAFGAVRATLDKGSLGILARLPSVMWIDRQTQPYVFNDIARWVIQSWDSVNYATPIHDHGIWGTGQTVTLGDTGIDFKHPAFWDPDNATPGPTARKVTDYYEGCTNFCDLTDNGINHGTHTSGTIAGDDGVWHVYDGDPLGSNNTTGPHDGQAFDAKIQMQDLSNDGYGVYYDSITQLWQMAVDRDSWIHSNSWGSCCSAYIPESAATDDFIFNNQDFLVVFAAGNAGSSAYTMNPFAGAKNVIAVGATENGPGAENVAGFSSRGPMYDGRLKPDVMAPGVSVWSAEGLDPGGDGTGYIQLSGTSMATPTAAGGAALVRQYYMDGWYPTGTKEAANAFTPTAALIKATLVNGAVEMTGTGAYGNGEDRYPNDNQGFGRILLDNGLYFLGDARGLTIDDHRAGLNTGDSVSYGLAVGDASQPLEVTLAYSDYMGNPATSPNLVNDLDLVVTAPDGTTYYGNRYTGFSPGESAPNPADTDHLNNVEGVLVISNIPLGLWTVTVRAANVPQGPQSYALVMTGGFATEHGVIGFDRSRYQSSATVNIKVVDTGLDLDPNNPDTVDVDLTSTTETTPEVVTLTETGDSTAVFAGSIPLQAGAPVSGDGRLQVTNGDTVTGAYFDADDGLGGSGTVYANAIIDDNAPIISNVMVTAVRFNRATIVWGTDEISDSAVRWGGSTPPGNLISSARLTTSHSLLLQGLAESTTYYFAVASTDLAGNLAYDDNASAYYWFTTPPKPPDAPPDEGWPTFHNNAPRHGVSSTVMTPPLARRWSAGPNTQAIWSGPVEDGGILFSTTLDGVIRAYDAFSGDVLWSRALGGQYYYTSFPTVANGVVYVVFDGPTVSGYYALDAGTGETIWSDMDLSGYYNARVALAYADGRVFGSTWRGEIFALDAADGSLLWSTNTGLLPFGGMTVSVGKVFMPVVDPYNLTGHLYALDETTGARSWSVQLDDIATSIPLYAQGSVFEGTYSGSMYALDALTGAIVWRATGLTEIDFSTPAYDGVGIYFGTFGYEYVGLDVATGDVLWRTPIFGPVGSSMAYANGYLYGTSWDGYLRVLWPSNGTILQEIPLDARASTSSPAITRGWVWVEDLNGEVYGFGVPGAGEVRGVFVVPDAFDVPVTGAALVRARGIDSFGNALRLTDVTWTDLGSLGTILPVGSTGDQAVYVAGAVAGPDSIEAASAGYSATGAVNILPGPLDHVTIDPSVVSVVAGTTKQFAASAQDRFGNELSGATFTWAVTGGIGSVDASGLFTASTTVGTGTVTARTGIATGIASVQVVPGALASIDVSPSSLPAAVAGSTLSLVATARDPYGNVVSGGTLTWSATAGSLLQLSADGRLYLYTAPTAASTTGGVTITVSSGGVTRSIAVTVVAGPTASVTISAPQLSVAAGASITLTATLTDMYGNTVTGATVTWSATAGSITSGGVLTAPTQAGTVLVGASAAGRQAFVAVAVTAGSLDHLEPSSSSVSVATGAGAVLTVVGLDAYGNEVSGLTYTWTSTIGTVASSGDGHTAGFFAGDSGGSGTIAVSAGGQTATISVSVTETSLPIGRQFTQAASIGLLAVAIAAIAASVLLFARWRAAQRELEEMRKGGSGGGGGGAGGEG